MSVPWVPDEPSITEHERMIAPSSGGMKHVGSGGSLSHASSGASLRSMGSGMPHVMSYQSMQFPFKVQTQSDAQQKFDYKTKFEEQRLIPVSKMQISGADLLLHPRYNKGLAFTWTERRYLDLHGLLPPCYRDLSTQAKQIMLNVRRMTDSLAKYMYFMGILDANEKLFYTVLAENLLELMPIIYTPTVGLACQKYGYVLTQPRGMFLTIRDRGRIYQMLRNWPNDNVRAIVVTDGERVLGLGDLGAQGMGIAVGKLALYVGIAGIPPDQCLPIMIDTGTDNEALRNDKFYIGLRQKRVRTEEYDLLMEEFMHAVVQRWGPTALVQYEDFANLNSFRLLSAFRDRFCTFNNDLQGSAAVALAGFISSLRMKGSRNKLSGHRVLIMGAGSAGIGIANLISYAISRETGHPLEMARENVWLVDSKGLIFQNRPSGGITLEKAAFAHQWIGSELTDLKEIVDAVRATALIGVSNQPGVFTAEVCKSVMEYNDRPVLLSLSTPNEKEELSPEDAYKFTNGQCIYASGNPHDSFKFNGTDIHPSQGNNAWIFPGLALGVMATQSTNVTDKMILAAATKLSSSVTDEMLSTGRVFPPIEKIRDVTLEVAISVAQEAYRDKVATRMHPVSIRELVISTQYNHNLNNYYHQPAFDTLEQDFSTPDVDDVDDVIEEQSKAK